jgi:hypothetical protein
VPVLSPAAVFAATLNVTVPVPDPLAPVTVIQLTLLDAVQAHPLVVVTVKEPVPPALAIHRLAGEIAYAHAAAPACVTVKT